MKGNGTKRRFKSGRTGRSLNLILWFAFSLFALIALLCYVLVQNVLFRREHKERTASLLCNTGAEMSREIGRLDADGDMVEKRLFDIAERRGVTFKVIKENGDSALAFSDKNHAELANRLGKILSDEKPGTILSSDTEMVYAQIVTFEGNRCYLCVGSSIETIKFNGGLGAVSLSVALFAMVLAFVASGFFAMLITKPVTEVTERAKELARGNYNLNFKTDYYCTEMNELAEALEYASSEISKADKMQKELIANVSHDLKTPLTMIKAYASMIREISGDDKQKREQHTQIIIDESDRLAALVGDLLDLSRVRAGLNEEFTVFNLSDLVYSIVERFHYLCETQGYTLITEVEDNLYARASRARIEQVMYNLIGNAVNYTGGDKQVRVRLFSKGTAARFEVIDTGKGISPEETATIWDRYYRSAEAHKRPVQGTGLGLSIVKGILIGHGFPFGVESEEGKGSCFWAEFPPPEDEATPPVPQKESRRKIRKNANKN